MPTYTINGKKVTTDTELTDAQIEEIAAEISPIDRAVSRQEPSFTEKFTSSNLPQELASDISKWWEARTSSNVPEPLDIGTSLKRIGTDTATMAALGSVIPGYGTIAGAASGAIGGIAGEVARNLGASDVATFGAEMLGGELPVVLEAGAKGIGKVISPASYRGGRAVGLFESDRLRQESLNQVKKNYFGKPAFDLDVIPQNTEKFQVNAKASLGIPETSPESVSTILRQKFYDDVAKLSGEGTKYENIPATYDNLGMVKTPATTKIVSERTGFITSPEHKQLVEKLDSLKNRNRMSVGEAKNLNNILKLEVSKNPEDRKAFIEELTNYIQNGGSYEVSKIDGKPQIAQKINSSIQKELRDSFDKYLERTLGTKRFSELKEIEKKEFEAKALDLIPTIISSKGKLPREDLDFIMSNVKNSPVVKSEFSKALMQRLSDPKLDTSDKLLTEFRKYNQDLVGLGVFDRKGLQEFYTKLNKFDKNVQKKEIKNLILSSLVVPVTTAEVATVSSNIFPSPLPNKQAPIGVFGM